MKKKETVEIDSISSVHGEWPGAVDVSYHHVVDGIDDGYQTTRIALPETVIKNDGEVDNNAVIAAVLAFFNLSHPRTY